MQILLALYIVPGVDHPHLLEVQAQPPAVEVIDSVNFIALLAHAQQPRLAEAVAVALADDARLNKRAAVDRGDAVCMFVVTVFRSIFMARQGAIWRLGRVTGLRSSRPRHQQKQPNASVNLASKPPLPCAHLSG